MNTIKKLNITLIALMFLITLTGCNSNQISYEGTEEILTEEDIVYDKDGYTAYKISDVDYKTNKDSYEANIKRTLSNYDETKVVETYEIPLYWEIDSSDYDCHMAFTSSGIYKLDSDDAITSCGFTIYNLYIDCGHEHEEGTEMFLGDEEYKTLTSFISKYYNDRIEDAYLYFKEKYNLE